MFRALSTTTKIFISFMTSLFLLLQFIGCTSKKDSESNEFNYVVIANIKGMDPIQADDYYSHMAIAQIYETLYQYHYLKRPLELMPMLAAEMPVMSKDGLTYTIKLKQGVMFQDDPAFPNGKGREMVAEDFVYSIRRLADPKEGGTGFWMLEGKVKGLDEWRKARSEGTTDYSAPIEGLKTIDKYTLQFKLKQPYYQLNYVLAHSFTAVVPKEAVDKYGKEFINHPVGTGPFKLEKWTRASKMTLVKNPTWRGETYPTEGESGDQEKGLLVDAGKKLPFVDKITIHEIREDQPRWLNFMKGALDQVSIPKDNFDSAVKDKGLTDDMKAKGIYLFTTLDPDVTYNAFNMLDPILGKNAKLRKAMSLAYDADTSIEKFYNGRAIAAQSPIPPAIDGYDPNFKNPYRGKNLERAKQLLKEAGYPNGKGLPEFEYATLASATSRQMAEYFQRNMAEIGIKIKIVTSTWPQFTDKIRNKKNQIWGVAWLADYPDAENFLQLLYGKNAAPGPNGSNFNNKEYNKIYEKALLLPPGPERTKLYHQMRDLFVEHMPWILGVHRLGYHTVHGWVHNYKRHLLVGEFMKYIRVDTDEKAKLKPKL